MPMKDKMHTGSCTSPATRKSCANRRSAWSACMISTIRARPKAKSARALLKEMFAEIGEGCYIEPPLYANHAGGHVHFGKGIYCNFGLTLVDDTHIYVGDHTMFGPNVVVATAGHPILPELRQRGYQYNFPVRIGKNCWIGAGVLIMPGITIGDHVVLGAGSVVTRDIPSRVVAAGNPCRVLREVNERDRAYYFRDRAIDWDALE